MLLKHNNDECGDDWRLETYLTKCYNYSWPPLLMACFLKVCGQISESQSLEVESHLNIHDINGWSAICRLKYKTKKKE